MKTLISEIHVNNESINVPSIQKSLEQIQPISKLLIVFMPVSLIDAILVSIL